MKATRTASVGASSLMFVCSWTGLGRRELKQTSARHSMRRAVDTLGLRAQGTRAPFEERAQDERVSRSPAAAPPSFSRPARGRARCLRSSRLSSSRSPVSAAPFSKGAYHRMQSLLRSVFRAGSCGPYAKLLECATGTPAVLLQPVASQASVNLLRPLIRPALMLRGLSTVGNAEVALEEDDSTSPAVEHPLRIKFKRPDKTARHIMNILNKEAVEKVHSEREIPDVQPGCIIQMRLQVPENKRRESTLKGIVIGRRNAGINTTFRLRRLVAGVGVESVFPLYSPNIKEIKILDRKKVRRAKLYYLRDRMNALKK